MGVGDGVAVGTGVAVGDAVGLGDADGVGLAARATEVVGDAGAATLAAGVGAPPHAVATRTTATAHMLRIPERLDIDPSSRSAGPPAAVMLRGIRCVFGPRSAGWRRDPPSTM